MPKNGKTKSASKTKAKATKPKAAKAAKVAKPKAAKAKATKAPAVEETVTVTTTTTTEVVEETVAPPTLSFQFSELLTQLSVLRTQVTSITSQLRQLQKRSEREIKAAEKQARKRKNKKNGQPRAPSGFVKPTLISDELASFLKKEKGTQMARTEVTKEIQSYILAHELQDPSNGRIIRADSKLRKLLDLPKGQELTYFNLQKYMSRHFPMSKKALAKKAAEAAASSSTQ